MFKIICAKISSHIQAEHQQHCYTIVYQWLYYRSLMFLDKNPLDFIRGCWALISHTACSCISLVCLVPQPTLECVCFYVHETRRSITPTSNFAALFGSLTALITESTSPLKSLHAAPAFKRASLTLLYKTWSSINPSKRSTRPPLPPHFILHRFPFIFFSPFIFLPRLLQTHMKYPKPASHLRLPMEDSIIIRQLGEQMPM